MSILGNKILENKFKKLQEVADSHVRGAVRSACQNVVKKEARLLCPVNHGELRQSIKTKTQKTEDGAMGEVYTNKHYAVYVEFGTGPVGEKNHNGTSPLVDVAYSQKGWYIPSDAISLEDAERYQFPKIQGKDMEFYYTQGQPAQPFLYPALHNNQERVVKNMNNYIQRKIREAIK